MNWIDFLFGRGALQNYLSEAVGIAITIVVVDRIVRHRLNATNRSRRDMCCALVYERIDTFLFKYLPKQHVHVNSSRSLNFGGYFASGHIYSFHESVVSRGELGSEIEDSVREWQVDYSLPDEAQLVEAESLRQSLREIEAFGKDINAFALNHEALLDKRIIKQLAAIHFMIAQEMKNYYEPLRPRYRPCYGVHTYGLMPRLLIECVEVSLALEARYGHNEPGFGPP